MAEQRHHQRLCQPQKTDIERQGIHGDQRKAAKEQVAGCVEVVLFLGQRAEQDFVHRPRDETMRARRQTFGLVVQPHAGRPQAAGQDEGGQLHTYVTNDVVGGSQESVAHQFARACKIETDAGAPARIPGKLKGARHRAEQAGKDQAPGTVAEVGQAQGNAVVDREVGQLYRRLGLEAHLPVQHVAGYIEKRAYQERQCGHAQQIGIQGIGVPAPKPGGDDEEEADDGQSDEELQREQQIVVTFAGFLGTHNGLSHPAAGNEPGQAGKDLDGRHHAEFGRHQEAREYQSQREVDDLAAGVANEDPLGAMADGMTKAHFFLNTRVLDGGMGILKSKLYAWVRFVRLRIIA